MTYCLPTPLHTIAETVLRDRSYNLHSTRTNRSQDVIQWKPLIMITLGLVLFDNNNRLITLSGGYKNLHYLTQFIVTVQPPGAPVSTPELPEAPIQYNRISSLDGNEVCRTSTLFNDRPVLSAYSNSRFQLLNPSAHSKLEYRMLFPNNETGNCRTTHLSFPLSWYLDRELNY